MKEKKPAITPKMATTVLEHHLGKDAKAITQIHGGLANYVFEARVGREDFVVRLSSVPAKLQTYMKEQWAVSAARKKQVPTPEILEVSNDVVGFPYMILRKVVGEPATSNGHRRMEVLRELGNYAAKINSIPTHDFGHIFDWSPNKLSRNRTWLEYLEKELEIEQRLQILGSSGVIDESRLLCVRKQFELMKSWKEKPTLSHGDIRLKNVILDKKSKIATILDWENCTSHIAPYWELSIALHDLSMDEKQAFLDGYGIDLKQYMRMAPAIKALNILNYARTILHAVERKDKRRLLHLRARLNGAFDLYSL